MSLYILFIVVSHGHSVVSATTQLNGRWGRQKLRSSWYSWLSIDDALDPSTTSAMIRGTVYHTYSLQHAWLLWRREENRTG